MLIRWATHEDRDAWISLAADMADVFSAPDMPRDPEFSRYVDSKLAKFEAIAVVDRVTGTYLGIIGFSRTHNRISWFGVLEVHRGKGVGAKLLRCALNQLDPLREISVETFRAGFPPGVPARGLFKKFGFVEVDGGLVDTSGNPRCRLALAPSGASRGGSFHFQYPRYAEWSEKKHCPVCNREAMPEGEESIAELPHSWVVASPRAQGRLFGKCHVVSKAHSVDFGDLPNEEMADFMGDVQRAAQALRKVTGAVRINYEIHGNTAPHPHVHLFPRYLDDDFPSAPIDHRVTEPSPYESNDEYRWFIEKMRAELRGHLT